MKHLGDILNIRGDEIPVVDVIVGGSPCQDLSVAGKRGGLRAERSGLFMEQIRIVKEMRERDKSTGRPDEYIRPRYMVWENVPGAFSSNRGKDFQAVLEEIVKIVEPDAPNLPTLIVMGGAEMDKIWMLVRRDGKVVGCLESTRRAVLGSPPEKKTNRSCRRFWRTQRSRNTI